MPTTVSHTRRFDSLLKDLAKRFPSVLDEVDKLVEQLEQDQRPGKPMRRMGGAVYRVRLRNRDARRGKRAGFRIAYHIALYDRVTLLAICVRADCDELAESELRSLVRML